MASGSSIQTPFVASLPSKHRRIHASCASLLGPIAAAAICTKLWSASTLVQRIGVTRARHDSWKLDSSNSNKKSQMVRSSDEGRGRSLVIIVARDAGIKQQEIPTASVTSITG